MTRKRILREITRCPSCDSEEILKTRADYICSECEWNSARLYVEAGGMENLTAAYFEHFGREEERPEERMN